MPIQGDPLRVEITAPFFLLHMTRSVILNTQFIFQGYLIWGTFMS